MTYLRVSSADLAEGDFESVIRSIRGIRDLEVRFGGAKQPSVLRIAVLLAAAAHEKVYLRLRFDGSTSDIARQQRSSPIRAFYGDRPTADLDVWLQTGLERVHESVDSANGTITARCATLSTTDRDAFQVDLLSRLRLARVPLPASVLGTVVTAMFEACTNAEEHGAILEKDGERTQLRVFSLRYLRGTPNPSTSLDKAYLDSLLTHGRTAPTAWIEAIVLDSGMGLSYPAYFVRARQEGRANADIYLADPAEERVRLRMLLNEGLSTKGQWGRSLNLQTRAGDGTRLLRFQLASVRGFAQVRTGRSLAGMYYSSATLTARERAQMSAFEVVDEEYSLCRGTVWHMLIPLDTQLQLGL